MPLPVSQATFDATAKTLLAAAADMLAAERRSYAAIEAVYSGSTDDDAHHNLIGVADSLDALAADLRSS